MGVVGIAGESSREIMNKLQEALRRWGLIHVRVKAIDTLKSQCISQECWTCSLKRGDCHACQLASYDIGIAWYQKDWGAPHAPQKFVEAEKPSQRFLNMLAVGLPVVA